MKNNLFKIFFLLLISTFIFFFHSDNTKSCGYEYDEPYSLGLFIGDVIKESTLSPFFFKPQSDYYGYPKSDSSLITENDNLREWRTFFNNNESNKEISYLIYKSSLPEVESIISAINNSDSLLSEKLRSSSLVQSLVKNNSIEFLDYLLYAKQCEPQALGYRQSVWDEILRDTVEMKILIEDGLKRYDTCNNLFLKARYAYQIIRLTHYLKHYHETIRLYDSLIEPLSTSSIIKYWALSHKAGALASIGEYSHSNYLFAKIFDECMSKRILASQNFKIRDASLLYETLNYCHNNREKSAVWFLHSYYSDDMGGMKNIYELEPSSPYLEVLLTRAIDRLEYDKYRYWQNVTQKEWTNNFTRLDHDQFYNFIKTCAESRKTKRPYFWYFCAGYISLLRHDFNSMKQNFQITKSLLPNGEEDFIERMKILDIYSKVDEAKEINPLVESKLVGDLKWLLSLKKRHADEAFKWAMLILAEKYITQKDTAKQQLCLGQKLSGANYYNTVGYLDYKSDPSSVPLQKLIWFINDDYNRPEYETFLLNNFCYTKKDILEIQGTLYLSRYEFSDAIMVMYDIKNDLELLPADPFSTNIKDCTRCDMDSLKEKIYTKRTFARRMKDLEEEIKVTNKNLAENYFLLANAYYNMSFFGNSWMIADFYREHVSDDANYNNLDISKAEAYYLKAMTLSKDNEFIAKCTFMAAKCEQNRFYFDKGFLTYTLDNYGSGDLYPSIKKENYKTYFQVLKDKYSKTQFYKEALKECKYFDNFVKGSK
jgi:hypothetical protein